MKSFVFLGLFMPLGCRPANSPSSSCDTVRRLAEVTANAWDACKAPALALEKQGNHDAAVPIARACLAALEVGRAAVRAANDAAGGKCSND